LGLWPVIERRLRELAALCTAKKEGSLILRKARRTGFEFIHVMMRAPHRRTAETTRRKAAGAALILLAGAAGCGVEALRTHLWISALGPICGLDRPGLFLLGCPACPLGLALLAAAGVFGALALRPLPPNIPVRVRR
jgi:hypothetical protein